MRVGQKSLIGPWTASCIRALTNRGPLAYRCPSRPPDRDDSPLVVHVPSMYRCSRLSHYSPAAFDKGNYYRQIIA